MEETYHRHDVVRMLADRDRLWLRAIMHLLGRGLGITAFSLIVTQFAFYRDNEWDWKIDVRITEGDE